MVMAERWRTPDDLDAHFATPHFRHVAEVLDRILAMPMTMSPWCRNEASPPEPDAGAWRRVRLGRRISTGADPIGW
ncbi:hypothetical protein C8258_18920 [Nocardia sp. MDA0666]|nr:hypothetical protein C8258_18920 [Nocardia sp. MDA0666]